MIRKEKNGIAWLEFSLFQPYPIQHAIFLRHGGFSQGAFESLNFSTSIGDDPNAVRANEDKVRSLFTPFVRAKLCHGKKIAHVPSDSPCDGLITQTPHLGLLITHADCQAAIFYDPKTHTLANVHSGWRGSVQNIYAETIFTMQQLGASPADIRVGISPSLGPQHAEFIHYRTELPQSFWAFQPTPNHFDFWQISRMQLEAAGILPQHIEIASLCTYAHPEDFFSYRRDKTTGRHATLAALA